MFITEDEAFVWHPSLAEQGFGPAQRVAQAIDEEKGPRLVFADGTESIYLADMCGDGLTDLARIRNGEVCYWPNLGYGRFGAKVTMDDSPYFDHPDQFDQKRVRLGDIDGSGTTDIIYLHGDGVQLYFNQSGNGWSRPRTLGVFAPVSELVNIEATDLLGNGTACLVWSSPLPGDAARPMRYVKLMGNQKPHLLIKIVNNLGAETRIEYAPSTKFYLLDKQDSKPWITRLPFPVQVVERVETYDHISRNRFITRYAYHHGYFDGEEREFRGFGFVEQWDTESVLVDKASSKSSDQKHDAFESYVPPVRTMTWFHTGAYLRREAISRYFESEYFPQALDANEMDPTTIAAYPLLDDTILPRSVLNEDGTRSPHALDPDEIREACRALKGSILRQEIYAEDDSPMASYPYSVSERNYTIEMFQKRGNQRHAVFHVHSRETTDYHYERNSSVPRISHQLVLAVDRYGNTLQEVSIGYGLSPDLDSYGQPLQRDSVDETSSVSVPRLLDFERDPQISPLVTYTVNRYTKAIDNENAYRTPLLCESQTYEITGPGFQPGMMPATFDYVAHFVKDSSEIAYHELPDRSKHQHRLIEHVRTYYRSNGLSQELPLEEMDTLGLPYETYQLAFTSDHATTIFDSFATNMVRTEGGYVQIENDNNWWIPSGRIYYSPNVLDGPSDENTYANAHFYLPQRYHDAFDAFTRVTYGEYDLLILDVEDPAGNHVTAGDRFADGTIVNGNDYRVLQPATITDPNGNRSVAAFDALGMVVGTAVMGKIGQVVGDNLDGFEANLDELVIRDLLQEPLSQARNHLGNATNRMVYDLTAYMRTQHDIQPQPTVAYTIAREMHTADIAMGSSRLQHRFVYSDGFGREIQTKLQAEPGLIGEQHVERRWVGSGWTIYNNKGSPVRKYEPFFSTTHLFEFAAKTGVSSVLFYDPLGRVIGTLHPNDTYEKVEFGPWFQATYDVNDTVATSAVEDETVGYFVSRLPEAAGFLSWHEQRQHPGTSPQEQSAAEKAEFHANTPTFTYLDTLGRTFLTLALNRFEEDGTTE
ncbi:MAG: toxin, partial [Anaerolineae bacterium]|nr:toxin [Anaerolineae bacterium]